MDRGSHEEIVGLYKKYVPSATPEDLSDLATTAIRYVDPETLSIVIEGGYRPTPENLMSLAYKDTVSYRSKEGDMYKTTCILIDGKASPLRKNEEGNTCYHIAARSGNGEFIKALADKGVKLTLSDEDGRSGLHLVSEYCYNTLKKVEDRKKALQTAETEGDEKRITSLKKDLELAVYDLEDYFRSAKTFLESGVDVDQVNSMGEKAHDLAVRRGAKKIASLLSGEYSEDSPDSEQKIAAGGMTIHQATVNNDCDAINAIIDMGADPNETNDAETFNGMVPLGIACSLRHVNAVKSLLAKGADPNLKDAHGLTPLAIMICTEQRGFPAKGATATIVGIMAENGLDMNGTVDEGGNSLLTLICTSTTHPPDISVAEECIFRGTDVNLTNQGGQTALMLASGMNWKEAETLHTILLENGADAMKKDNWGNTALMYASNNSDLRMGRDMAVMMFELGQVSAKDVNNDGKTALDYAVTKNNETLVKLLLQKTE